MAAPRRTQSERTAHTRGLLIEAAVDALVENGWAATTAVEVCRRTGLTRGALVHHFPNLAGLLAAALESVYDDLIAAIESEPRTIADAVDATWRCVRDPRFKAVIEAWLAAANDADLRHEIGPVITRFSKLVDPRGALHDVVADPDTRLFSLTARETMLGLALGRAVAPGHVLPHEREVIGRLRAEAAALESRKGASR